MNTDNPPGDTGTATRRWPYRNTVLALCILAFFGTMVARLAVSPVVPAITARFGVSDGEIGTVLTGMWVAYALAHYPSGVFGDRFGERRIVLCALGITAVCGVSLAVAPSYLSFAVFAVVLGAGAGLYYPSGASLLSKQFTNVGQAMGFHIAGSSLAGLVTPVLVTLVAVETGWRTGLLLAPAIVVPVWLLFAWYVRPVRSRSGDASESTQKVLDLRAIASTLGRPVMLYTVTLAVIQTFVFSATLSFLPTFLTAYHQVSPVLAGTLFSLFFVVLGVAQPTVGLVSDRAGRDVTAALAFGFGAVGYVLLVVSGSTAVLALGVALAGTGMSSAVALDSKFMDNIAVGDRGSNFGVVRTTYVLLGACGSAVTGAVSDAFGWATAVEMFVVILVLAVVVIGLNRLGPRL